MTDGNFCSKLLAFSFKPPHWSMVSISIIVNFLHFSSSRGKKKPNQRICHLIKHFLFTLLLMSACSTARFTICHKTEVIKNTLNPAWQPFTIPVRALCNGDYDR